MFVNTAMMVCGKVEAREDRQVSDAAVRVEGVAGVVDFG